MALVTATNKRTGKDQIVPEHYVDNPQIFGGAFTAVKADKTTPAEPDASKKEK